MEQLTQRNIKLHEQAFQQVIFKTTFFFFRY